ncbi:hypothetical protein CTAYLR_009742, partial [Chrysophaeum taylorii]
MPPLERFVLAVLGYAVARLLQQQQRPIGEANQVEKTTEELARAYHQLAAAEETLVVSANLSAGARLQDLMDEALVPGTIATSALRAATSPARRDEARRESWAPACATVVESEPRRWVQRRCEAMVVKFIRQIIEDHDVLSPELSDHTKARRLRKLRHALETLGSMHNVVAPVFVRGRLGLPRGVRVRRAEEVRAMPWPSRRRRAPRLPGKLPLRRAFSGLVPPLRGPPLQPGELVHREGTAPRYFWFEPTGCDTRPGAPTLVYLHGGGFIVGSSVTNGEMVARIAAACGVRTLLVEYRRSPEARFPDALVDALGGIRAVLASGVPPERLLLGGDSAGGALALAALLTLERVDVVPRAAVLLSPLVDLDPARAYASDETDADIVPSYGLASKRAFRDMYHRTERRADHRALVSPAAASNRQLRSLRDTSILIHVGGREVLRDSICEWADRASRAGADVKVNIYDGECHAFQAFAFAPAWPDARRNVAEFVASVLAEPRLSRRAARRRHRRPQPAVDDAASSPPAVVAPSPIISSSSPPSSSSSSNAATRRVSKLLAIIRR